MSELLTPDEQTQLLRIARETIVAHVSGDDIPAIAHPSRGLRHKHGCFVTIKQRGQLRGCIGNFVSDKPLHQLVQEMALSAATRDPRFYPMKSPDLADFRLEISVLSALKQIGSVDSIVVGKHGLYVVKNHHRGVLLPQVASEYGWDRDTFLRHVCLKAGLPEDAWQKECEIYTFTALVFGEDEPQ